MKNIFLILSLVTIVFTSCFKEDNDGVISATTTLTGANVVPAVTTTGTAKMDYAYNQNTRTFTYVIEYSNLADSCTQFGISNASAGQALPSSTYQLFNFGNATSLQRRTSGRFQGQFVVDGQSITLNDLRSGRFTVFLRSKINSANGEVRGQISF